MELTYITIIAFMLEVLLKELLIDKEDILDFDFLKEHTYSEIVTPNIIEVVDLNNKEVVDFIKEVTYFIEEVVDITEGEEVEEEENYILNPSLSLVHYYPFWSFFVKLKLLIMKMLNINLIDALKNFISSILPSV